MYIVIIVGNYIYLFYTIKNTIGTMCKKTTHYYVQTFILRSFQGYLRLKDYSSVCTEATCRYYRNEDSELNTVAVAGCIYGVDGVLYINKLCTIRRYSI